MIPETDLNAPELVKLRQEISFEAVQLAYLVQHDPVETGEYVGLAQGLLRKVEKLYETSGTW